MIGSLISVQRKKRYLTFNHTLEKFFYFSLKIFHSEAKIYDTQIKNIIGVVVECS